VAVVTALILGASVPSAFADPAAAGSPPGAGSAAPRAQTLLKVDFEGSFEEKSYTPAGGEIVRGTLARDGSDVRVDRGKATLPGGASGLRFTPDTPLAAEGHITGNLVAEAVVKRSTDVPRLGTLLSLFGSPYYRYKDANDFETEFGMSADGAAPVRGQGLMVPKTQFRHVALVYTSVSATRSTLRLFLDGCAVGKALELGALAPSRSEAVGFGRDTNPSAADRGFAGGLDGIALSTFDGEFSSADFRLEAPAQRQTKGPGQVVTLSPCDTAKDIEAKAANVVPSERQKKWMNDELTAFVHFGINTFAGADGVEWGSGEVPPSQFAPTDLDARQWARALKDAGFKVVIFTAKHHEGFSMWPSRYTDYSVKNSPYQGGKGDVVREFVEAARAEGLRAALYLSPADVHQYKEGVYNNNSAWKKTTIPTLVRDDNRAEKVASGELPTFDVVSNDYNRYYENQLYELLTEYGPVDEVWMDGANPVEIENPGAPVHERHDYATWYRMVRALQPQAVIQTGPQSKVEYSGPDARWVGNESGVGRETEWSVLPMYGDAHANEVGTTPCCSKVLGAREQLPFHDYLRWLPAETDVSIRPGWFYHSSQDSQIKSLPALLGIYNKSVGRNGVLLLNVPPDRRGKFTDGDVRRLHEFGEAIRTTFGKDLATGATVTSADPKETTGKHRTATVVDSDASTYWTPRSGSAPAELVLDLPAPRTFTTLSLQESMDVGQRIEKFAVDAWLDGGWTEIGTGTTVGYKRLLNVAPTTTDRLRLRILESRLAPSVAGLGLFRDPAVGDPGIAVRKPAQQSSTAYDGTPDRAVDGNTDGTWGNGSVTHTSETQSQPWWQVDLGSSKSINKIAIWNRTDCCGQRLSNYYVIVSDTPLPDSLDEALATPGVWSSKQTAQAGTPTEIPVGRSGRYVRVQLTGTSALSLAEVQVF
jgi:alpha-L-fucosidase